MTLRLVENPPEALSPHPAWRDPRVADFFKPSLLQVRLDPEATRALLDARCSYGGNRRQGWKWGATYRLFTHDGACRRDGPWALDDWRRAVTAAAFEQLVIYNGRSHKASRPVWYSEPQHRTLDNCSFSAVVLMMHGPTYNHECSFQRELTKGEVLVWE